MIKSRFAGRVGLFVVLTLIVLIGMFVVFTRGGGFKPSYVLQLRAETVSNLKKGSLVLMAGVPIGAVSEVELEPGGKGVIIDAKIEKKYKIRADAKFLIEQLGFLGDQFISVYPQANAAPVLQPGALVRLEQPFDLQETARSATALVDEAKVIVKSLNDLALRVDQKVLSETNLSNVDVTLNNLRVASDKVIKMVDGINSESISGSVSNLARFAQRLNEFSEAMGSLDNTAETLERLAKSLEEGQGLAGALLTDEQLKQRFVNLAENLQNVSSNINRHGLLYKPKKPREPQNPPYPGKSPIR